MTGRWPGWRATVIAAVAYLLLALLVFANIWSADPSSTSLCGCGDPAYSLWFMGFAAHAVGHGVSPLWTSLMWHPHGVNVLDGATQLGLGIPLSPLTALAGSVASLNVALTLSPALSALAMFLLLRRWVTWQPAAFVGGLLFGFSPFVLMNLSQAHLVVGMLVVPPLIVAALDELVVTQHRRPVPVGLVLAGLVIWQFFVSTEVRLLTALACGTSLLVVGIRAQHRGASPERRRHALTGLATAAGICVVALVGPTWFALSGPAHVTGSYYPSVTLSSVGANLRWLVLPTHPSLALEAFAHRFGGYQGPTVPAEFVGPGVVLVVLVGLVAVRRDLRLWLMAGIGAAALLLSLGSGRLRPWSLFTRLPMVSNVVPVRFLVVVLACLAVMVAIVLDHVVVELRSRWPRRAPIAGMVLALLALSPIAVDLAPALPLTAVPVVVPRWFRTTPALGPHPVVLPIPVAFSAIQSSLAWQVVPRFRFAMAGGDGPGSDLSLAGRHRAAQEALMAVSGAFPTTPLGPTSIPAVARALRDWRVTRVVLPIDRDLPAYDRAVSPAAAAALITGATGRLPARVDGSLVWSVDPARASAPRPLRRLERCTVAGDRRPMAAARCMLSARPPGATTEGGAT